MVEISDVATLLEEEKLATPILLPRPDAAVEWVSSTELAHPAPFLEPRTLVLTNGLFATDEEAWETFVREAADAGVSGLGLGLGISFDAVPPSLIGACERAHLNLLCLAGHVPFVTVSRVVVRFLQERESVRSEEVPTALLTQQQLSRAALSGSRTAILRTLASILRATVAIHNTDGSPTLGPIGAQEGTYLDTRIDEAVTDLVRKGNRGSVSIVDQARRLTLLPLGLSGKPREYLGVVTEHPFGEWERSSLNLAMSLLSTEAQTRRTETSALNRAHRVAIRLLVDGNVAAARTVAREFNIWFPESTVQAYLVRANIRPDQIPGPALRTRWGKGLLVLAEEGFSAELITALPPGATVGVGEPRELAQAGGSVAQARQAARIATKAVPVVTWQDARVNSIAGCFNRELADQFVQHQLRPILGDDTLLETLEAYLVANGSIAAASTALGVHRNTLNYRLRQLRSRLGNIDDASTRANLWVALEMRLAPLPPWD